jgi:hypothetical protein
MDAYAHILMEGICKAAVETGSGAIIFMKIGPGI